MNLKRLWPWKTIERLSAEVAERDAQIARLQKEVGLFRNLNQTKLQEVQDAVNMKSENIEQLSLEVKRLEKQVEEKDQAMRKLGVILAMSKGIAVLFMLCCISAIAQPIMRQPFTTNTGPQIDAKAYSVSNLNALSVNDITNKGSLTSPNGLMSQTSIGPTITNGFDLDPVTLVPITVFHLITTNNPGWWVGTTPGSSDGSLYVTLDSDMNNGLGLIPIDPTNTYNLLNLNRDNVVVGMMPGFMTMATNGTVSLGDSVFVGTDVAPFATNIFSCAFLGGYAAATFILYGQFSTFAGTQAGSFINISVNDIYIGYQTRLFGSNRNSTNNTIIGWEARSGNGQTNTCIGAKAGFFLQGGNNIMLLNQGKATDNSVMRLGIDQTNTYLPPSDLNFPMTTVAPTAASIGGTVGSVTNVSIKNVNGALIKYWSDGTSLFSQEIGTH